MRITDPFSRLLSSVSLRSSPEVSTSSNLSHLLNQLRETFDRQIAHFHEFTHLVIRNPRSNARLIESTLVSLDGVTEAPERWANFDADATALSLEQLGNYDAFIMGRVTYEKFYANWGHISGNPYIDLINAMPKYVASRSLTQTAWNATLLGPDPSKIGRAHV